MTLGLQLLTLCLLGDAGTLPPDHPPVSGSSAAAGQSGAAGQGSMSAEEVLKRLDASKELKSRPKSFDVASAMSRLYYTHGRYPDALDFLREALGKAQGVESVASSARKRLGAAAYGQLKPALPSDCGWPQGATMETIVPLVQEKAKSDAKLGAACARTALKDVNELRLLQAQAEFVQKDPAAALKTLSGLLEVAPELADARYARGYILYDSRGDEVASLKAAKADIDGYLKQVPTGIRADEAKQISSRISAAIAAGGVTPLEKKRKGTEVRIGGVASSAGGAAAVAPSAAPMAGGASPPPLTQEMVDAVQNTERTPELEKKFAETVEQGEAMLAKGQYQEALDAYKRVIPFQPNNGRAKAGMAWALVGLDKQPMAERIWGIAVSSDAAAVDKLGDALKSKGDAKGAAALWGKLAQSSPDYAQRSGLQAKLK